MNFHSQKKPQSSLQSLDHRTLLEKTKQLVSEERKLTLEILHHLLEISNRRLFAMLGFSSLFDYATRELGYSEAAASRRIAATRLLKEIPEIEPQIEAGKLSLSSVAQAQRLFHTEEKSHPPIPLEAKREILKSLEGKSTREVERELIKHSTLPNEMLYPDRQRVVTENHVEVKFVAEQALLDQLDLIKGLLANKNPHLSFAELIGEMAKIALDKLTPKKPERESSKFKKVDANQNCKEASAFGRRIEPDEPPLSSNEEDTSQNRGGAGRAFASRHIPSRLKRVVYHRDQGICQFTDPKTGRKCGSRWAVQYDHIKPYALGGETTAENLRILCALHNRVRAELTFGQGKMRNRITPPSL